MTHPQPRGWDPFRPLDMLTSLWSTAAVAPVSNGAAMAYRTVFMTLRRLVVGRRLTVRLPDGEVRLTVTEFDSRLDLAALSVGQLNDVRIAARDIEWNGSHFDAASAVLHNVHMRPSAPPVLVAAPVDVTLDIATPVAADLLGRLVPRVAAGVDDNGVARLRLARRPRLGSLAVEAGIDGSTVWLRPRDVVLGRTRLPLPARMPAYPVRLPELPHQLILTGVGIEADRVRLSGTVPQWRQAVPRKVLDDIINQLSAVGRPLNLTRLPRLM
ncbi:MAG: hypothetical protein JST91_18180 [Actinobacteria bacterium]|nr:hypothetical protein [Actinomycetota bacterium]